MTKGQIEFIPMLIGIYTVLLTTYWVLKKLPAWLNKSKRLLNREERGVVKTLLHYLENTDYWEAFESQGLCGFVSKLYSKYLISQNMYNAFYAFEYFYRPKDLFPLEFNTDYYPYWFPAGNKQLRIDYLKRLLNE